MGAEMLSERRHSCCAAHNGPSDEAEPWTQEAQTTRRHVCTQEHTQEEREQVQPLCFYIHIPNKVLYLLEPAFSHL